jgi:hypothetical protein
LVKADISRPAQYGAVLALLLGFRLAVKWVPAVREKISGKPAAVHSRT